jgi:hypothetical protein
MSYYLYRKAFTGIIYVTGIKFTKYQITYYILLNYLYYKT